MKLVMPAVCLVTVLAAPLPAAAQDRGVFRVMGGATVGTESGGAFGAGVDVRITPKALIFGEFGRLQNVLPSSVLDQVEVDSAQVANGLGGKASSTASASATYGMVGLRMNLYKIGENQLFVEGGAGAAKVKSEVEAFIRGSATLQGDISDRVSVPFAEATPATKALGTFGGGVILAVNQRIGVEMGVRYFYIATSSPSISGGQIYGAVRFGF
jgi:opacity protein-like surface antigen